MSASGHRRIVLFVVTLVLVAAGGTYLWIQSRERGNVKSLDVSGLPNLHKLSDSLYRSGEPTAEGLKRAASQLGVRTVIDLAGVTGEAERAKTANLDYVPMPSMTFRMPEAKIVRFLRVVTDPKRKPILVHCNQGTYRTGTMIAAYRMVVDGWSPADAAREMTDERFKFSGYREHIEDYLRTLDIESIRRQVETDSESSHSIQFFSASPRPISLRVAPRHSRFRSSSSSGW
jgi:protein tyrosine/serine phosphatase